MSKLNRASKKKHDRDKRKKQKAIATAVGSRQPAARLSKRLTEAEGLISRRRLHEARELLEREDGKQQRSPELLEMQLYVYQEIGDHLMIARTAERLVRLQPGNADGWMMMAQGYMFCGRAAMAANAYRHFLERWPGHESAVKARKAAEIAGDAAAELLTDFGFSEDDFDWLVLHDEILFELSAGEFEDAVSKCRELLKAKPGVVSARNNLVLALFQLGRGAEARNVSRETVSTWPDNRFAEALNGRIEFLTGFAAEANVVADRIVRDPSDQQDAVAAQVEFLGTLGRDENVLSVVKFAEPIDKDPRCCAVLKHFEAVALMRSGRGAAAHASWKQCLEMDPGYPPATENLHDLNSSGGHAPWPDSIAKWIPKPVIEQFVNELQSGRSDDSGAFIRAVEKYPYFQTLVPALLDRGDPVGRKWAFLLARGVGSPEMLDALHDFAFSQRGPDDLRFQALTYLKEKGRLGAGSHRLYRDGDWAEIQVAGFDITDEPSTPINPLTVDLQAEGCEALGSGDAARGERIFRLCVEIDPDDPSSFHNLAGAILQQGFERKQEAVQLLLEIHERFPDYLFARTSLAQIAIYENDLERAGELLSPLHECKQMHISEAMAFMTASIELAIAQDKFDSAEKLLDSMKQFAPDDHRIAQLRRKIDHARQPIRNALKGFASGLRRR